MSQNPIETDLKGLKAAQTRDVSTQQRYTKEQEVRRSTARARSCADRCLKTGFANLVNTG